MKKILLLLLLIQVSDLAFSQFYNYEYGPVFPYPTSGTGKILAVKDGAIMYLQINTDSAIQVQFYESKYHVLSNERITPSFFPVRNAQIENVFSFRGDALIFISSYKKDSTLLYQLTLDGHSGKLKDARILYNIHHAIISKPKDEVQFPQFIVRQSSNNDAYAIAAVNPSLLDHQPVIQLSVFDTLGNEFKRPYKSKLPEKFGNLHPVDLVVVSPKQAVLLTYGFKEEQKIKNGDLIAAKLDKEKPDMQISALYYSTDLVLDRGVARYDAVFQKIYLASSANRQSESGRQRTDVVRIDVPELKIDNDGLLGFNTASMAKLVQITGQEKPLFTPVDFYLKGLTGFIVIYQQLVPGSPTDTSIHARINHTVVAEYNNDQENVRSYIIPSYTDIHLVGLPPFYLQQFELCGVPFAFENQYRTGRFITDGHSYFWVQNDVSTNFLSTDGTQLALFNDNKNGASFYMVLSGDGMIPRRQFLAGKPTDKNGSHLLIPGVGYYDKYNGVWVTLQDEPTEKYPGLKLVWLQP